MIIIGAIWNTFISVFFCEHHSTYQDIYSTSGKQCTIGHLPLLSVSGSEDQELEIFLPNAFNISSLMRMWIVFLCSEPHRIKKSNNIMNPN